MSDKFLQDLPVLGGGAIQGSNIIPISENGKVLKTFTVSSIKNILNTLGIRTVVETWNEGHNWYRIWSDGWIQQGGNIPFSATGGWTVGNITFFKPFSNINYSISGRGNWSDRQSCDFGINSKTATGCNVTLAINRYYGEENGMWRAEGY